MPVFWLCCPSVAMRSGSRISGSCDVGKGSFYFISKRLDCNEASQIDSFPMRPLSSLLKRTTTGKAPTHDKTRRSPDDTDRK